MKKIVTNWIKKIFSDLHSAIVGIVLLALLASGGGIYIFFRKLWDDIIATMKSPTPLWTTIILNWTPRTWILNKNSFTKTPLTAWTKASEGFVYYSISHNHVVS